MAEEDNFDIYGDENFDQGDDIYNEIVGDDDRPTKRAKADGAGDFDYKGDEDLFEDFGDLDKEMGGTNDPSNDSKQELGMGTDRSSSNNLQNQTYPVKRDGTIGHTPGSRMNVPNATTALYIADLNWWTSDEDIRQYCVEGGHDPSEIKEITFYEHKVNGKSRGVAYVDFASVDAAARTKEILESKEVNGKTPTVNFTTGHNPFKTVPKEPPPKSQRMGQGTGTGMARGNTRGGGTAQPPQQQPFQNQPIRSGFNPMMAARGAFGGMPGMPYPGSTGMPMNPYGFPPGRTAGYMNGFGGADVQMGGMGVAMGRGMMSRGNGRGMRGQGYPGMHINPAFFEQQQGYVMDDGMGTRGMKRGRIEDDQDGRY